MTAIKQIGKRILCVLLERQVIALRKRHNFTIIAVVGSVGKTSTKLAIANVLSADRTVRHQEGNYNDRLTVPLVIFGHPNPSLFNLLAWGKILLTNQIQIFRVFPYKTVVLELGTDAPGQIEQFAYLKPEIAVVTAATPEHMEFFGTVEAVAKEELAVSRFSGTTIVNIDDVPGASLSEIGQYVSYGMSERSDYRVENSPLKNMKQDLILVRGKEKYSATISLLGAQGAKVALGAFAAACEAGMEPKAAADRLAGLEAFAGRMRLFQGIEGSTIIDDTYNASPAAVKAALDVLYGIEAPQRIAILGMMNELGETSEAAHTDMGQWCDPAKLDLVVTIGKDARVYTAPTAKKRGCAVESFDSPYEAGAFVKSKLKRGAVVLAKGSQNRVFAEESLKGLLAHSGDKEQLVRQSAFWLGVKKQQFPEGDQ